MKKINVFNEEEEIVEFDNKIEYSDLKDIIKYIIDSANEGESLDEIKIVHYKTNWKNVYQKLESAKKAGDKDAIIKDAISVKEYTVVDILNIIYGHFI